MANQFNANDPRFQRAAQRASAKQTMGGSRRIGSVVDAEVTGRHAGAQADRRLQFGRLGLQSRLAQMQHEHRMASLANQGRMTGLREQALGFRESSFDDQIQAGNRDMLISTIMGGLGSVGSFIQGRDRKSKLAAANAIQKARSTQIGKLLDRKTAFNRAQTSRFRGGTGEGSLMAERFFKGGSL